MTGQKRRIKEEEMAKNQRISQLLDQLMTKQIICSEYRRFSLSLIHQKVEVVLMVLGSSRGRTNDRLKIPVVCLI